MQNRFTHLPPRLFAAIAVLLLSVSIAKAQEGAFIFTPPPPTIAVGNTFPCLGTVSSGPPPTVTPTTLGATITVSQFSPANSYGYNDTWDVGETLLVKWDVADNMGNSWQFEYGVTFTDATPPVFDQMATPPLLWVNSVLQLAPLGPITVTDNCSTSGMITQTFSQTTPPPLCQPGSMTRTWIATDESGNASTYTQVIQVFRDSLNPVITVAPVNGSAPCASLPGAYTSWLNTQMANFTAVDESGIDSYTNNAPPSLATCPAPITVEFTATDGCGFDKTTTATFSSSDTQPPVVITEPKDTIAYCGNHLGPLAEFIQTKAYSVVADACSPNLTWTMLVNGTVRDSAGVVADLVASLNNPCGVQLIGSQSYSKVRGYVRVDFFARDACNNQVFVGQGVFGVRDTTAPIITGPALVTEECGGGDDQNKLNAWINAHGNATFSDNCSAVTWTNFTFVNSLGQSGSGNFNTGPYPIIQANNCNWFVDVTFRASDDCGNIGSKTLRFKIGDTTPPVIAGFPDTTFIYCPSAIPSSFGATVLDNCATGITPTYTTQYSDTSCVGNYTLKILWSATDLCGNTGTKTQYYAIRDTIRPTFTKVPAGITVSCDSFQFVPAPLIGTDVTATDQCGAMQGITFTSSDNRNPDVNACGHYNFEITRIFTATDQCGNNKTATQVIQVRDTKGPVSAIPLTDIQIPCQNLPLAPVAPPATDNCSPVPGPVSEVSQTIVAGSCPDSYTIVVTWKATDVCGNDGFFSRNYLVIDTIKPTIAGLPGNITVECDAIPLVPSVNTLVLGDNCDALPGVSFIETELRDPDLNSCNHWSNYQIKREWTVTDACGNNRTYTQLISVMDNTPPDLLIKDTVSLPNTPGLCGTDVLPPTPLSAFDRCAVLPIPVTLLDTTPITGPPSSDVVCDTLVLVMSASHLPPLQPVQGAGSLTVYLDNADAEGPLEYFLVYGENGVLIDTTSPTAAQCGNGSTTFAVSEANLNDWLSDGQLTLTLVPFGNGPEAINPICPGRQVRAQLSYQYLDPQVDVQISYRFDNNPLQPYPAGSGTFLEVGTHTVTYVATDCVGNSVTKTAVITIDDIQAPLIAPPAAQTAFVGLSNCEATVTVPLPNVTENCDLAGYLMQSSPISNVKFQFNANTGYVPEMITLTINGLIPNAFTDGILTIKHKGQNSKNGQFFKVLDESNNQLSITNIGPVAGDCTTPNVTGIAITAAQINAWAANGSTQIKLIPNTDAINYSNFINPCGPLNAQNLDGISSVQAMIEYNYAVLNYTITNSQQTVVQSGTLFGQQNTASLTPGNYTINYSTTDISGNQGVGSMAVIVRDTVRPTALCQNRTIFTSVTGSNPVTLTSADINNGSVDNCSGSNLSFVLSQTNFTCNQSNQIIPVTLTVTDTSGNSNACIAMVNVQTETIPASAQANVCVGGTAQLSCTPPGNPTNYTYSWTAPGGSVISLVQNPILNNVQLSQEGTYQVVVTGPTGCTAAGLTQLQLIGLPYQPTIVSNSGNLCAGQNLTLTTNAYSGTDVSYQWYRNSIDTLISTTIQPFLNVNNPPAGNYQFFVRVVDLNCGSALSAPVAVVVNKPIAAVATQSALSPCEGDPISLGTNIQGPNITYMWTGPGGFMNTNQFPPAFASTLTNGGTYSLVVKNNGCPGTAANVSVTVRDRPDAPVITGPTGLCIGGSGQLTASPQGYATYIWVSPSLDSVTISGSNVLGLSDVSANDDGLWQVIAIQNGCVSPASGGYLLEIDAYPFVTINANTPLCVGSTLTLTAQVNMSVNYSWSGPNGFNPVGTGSPSTTTPASGVYTVTVTSTHGCSSTDEIDVLVVAPPIITSVTSNAPACVDGTTDIQLSPVIVSPYGPFTYNWLYEGTFFSALDNPVIAGATPANNGNYTLWVTDVYGCVSAPLSTTISVKATPPRPVINVPAAVCEGAGFTLTLQNPQAYPGNPTFNWNLPSGNIFTTSSPMYSVISASQNDFGFYTATVEIAGCASQISDAVFLEVNIKPNPPALETNSPVCEGDTLFLVATPPPGIPPDGLEWTWSGPAGFESDIFNPFIYPATLNNASDYNVKIKTAEGCSSSFGEPVTVEVKPQPKKPFLLGEGNICISPSAGDTLLLSISDSTRTQLATYTWYRAANHMPMGLPSFSPVFQITDFSGFSAGSNGFYVIANLDGCNSLKSNTIFVTFDTIPNITAFAGMPFTACVPGNFNLNAESPAIGTGFWSQVSGPAVSITNTSNVNPTIIGATAGNIYQFQWSLSNQSCKNYSRDTIEITAVTYQPAMATADIDTCFASSIQLSAQQGIFAPGFWTQPNSQSQLQPPIVITNPNDPNTTVTGIPPNTNNWYFVWNVSSAACGTSFDTVKVFIVATQKPNAGRDTTLCGLDGCITLNAQLQNNESGVWKSNDPGIEFSTPGSTNSEACGLKTGQNVLIWETNGGLCGDASRDQVVVNYQQTPDARTDSITVSFGTPLNLNILGNDIVPTDYRVSITTEPSSGELTRISEGQYSFLPDLGYSGTEVLTYLLCNQFCVVDTSMGTLNACDVATVYLLVGNNSACDDIPTVITPNGDGINDEFFIPCLSCADCPQDNELTVFNQWGDHVFNQSPYQQNWNGKRNGDDLPAGSYYYVLKYNTISGLATKTGFIIIQR